METDPVSTELLDGGVGYIKVENFYSNSAKRLREEVDALLDQGAKALVFDMRDNGGGYVGELTDMLDRLLPEGPIFRTRSKGGPEEVVESDEEHVDVPMAVLVNGNTYSAAEFFAAALKDYNWATIVGERTTGKGRSQITVELTDGSAVHISNGKYLTPNRTDLSAEGGLRPDIDTALTDSGDAQLSAALSEVQWQT